MPEQKDTQNTKPEPAITPEPTSVEDPYATPDHHSAIGNMQNPLFDQ